MTFPSACRDEVAARTTSPAPSKGGRMPFPTNKSTSRFVPQRTKAQAERTIPVLPVVVLMLDGTAYEA
ncbi:uncharacterized protein N7498_007301 [Penicillium cinerascens]|uniref:Uncharacterized protein n=1 Tax=Penicillium cinerascens TaxID=70096 RepID=A0A9W9JKX0_9EURO|nr:uncharacterized protein N7498_007301 [Penicillium cinerascens]KAJ5198184.1 hypothetical protein N7498_007301 [Penicillium cinerascens]